MAQLVVFVVVLASLSIGKRISLKKKTSSWLILCLPGFALLALPAFLPSVISSFLTETPPLDRVSHMSSRLGTESENSPVLTMQIKNMRKSRIERSNKAANITQLNSCIHFQMTKKNVN